MEACRGPDLKAAVQACTAVLALGGLDDADRVHVYVNRGNAYDDLGDSERAAEDYERALTIDPRNPRAHRNKGVMLKRQRRLSEALQELDVVIELEPDRAENYGNRAGVLFEQAGLSASEAERMPIYERALADYDAAIRMGGLGRLERAAYGERALVKCGLNRFDAAMADFSRTIELLPGDGVAYALRADCARTLAPVAQNESETISRYERAVADYSEAIRLGGLGGREVMSYFNRGIVHYYLRHFDAAISDQTRAIELGEGSPLLPVAYASRAQAYAAADDLVSATTDVQKASALSDDATVIRELNALRDYIAQKRR